MKFDVQKNGTSTTFTLHERKLDSSVSGLLKAEFLILCTPKVDRLFVDLGEVEFCDSSGLSALLIANRKMKEHGGKVTLVGVRNKVKDLLKITMLDREFDVQASAGRRDPAADVTEADEEAPAAAKSTKKKAAAPAASKTRRR